jgi:Arc/MetJ-type ribon-helix-helix transcriptional regulator
MTNRFNLRIDDVRILELLKELLSSGKFKTQTEVLNFALAYGLEELYKDTFGKKTRKAEKEAETRENLTQELKGIHIGVDQIGISLKVLELLCTVLYNLAESEAGGVLIDTALFESGALNQLPAFVAEIKETMTKNEFVKRRKK